MPIANREGGAVRVPEVGPEAATRVATRNRLPVGPTEAELLTGYQNTSTPAQGWSAGDGPTTLPAEQLMMPAETSPVETVTSPARADSLMGGAS